MGSLSELVSGQRLNLRRGGDGESFTQFVSPIRGGQSPEFTQLTAQFEAMPEDTYDQKIAKYTAAKAAAAAYKEPGDSFRGTKAPNPAETYITDSQTQIKALATQSPEAFAPFVDEYNNGSPISNPIVADFIGEVNRYHNQGETAPGRLTTTALKGSVDQWTQDGKPGGWQKAMDAVANYGLPVMAGMLLGPLGASAVGMGGSVAASTVAGALAGSQAGRLTDIGWEKGALAGGLGGYGAGGPAVDPALGASGPAMTAGNPLLNAGGAPILSGDMAALYSGMTGAIPPAAAAAVIPAAAAAIPPAAAAVIPAAAATGGLTLGELLLGGAGIGATIYGANQNADALKTASDNSTNATTESNKILSDIYKQSREDQMPWLDAGKRALTKQENLINDPSSYQQDPYNAWLQEQGRGQIDKSASSRGQLFSGGALKELTKYGQGMAGQGFNDQYNRLASLSGTGQVGATNLAGQGTNYANSVGANNMNNATNQGNYGMARAGQNNQMLSSLLNTGAGMYGMYNQNQQNSALIDALNRR